MLNPEIVEFARILVEEVRDNSIRSCDRYLMPTSKTPIAERWKVDSGGKLSSDNVNAIIMDCVDETIFHFLNAIDQGLLPLSFIGATGNMVDLSSEGQGELAGWYLGSEGWRQTYSKERFIDDFTALGSDAEE